MLAIQCRDCGVEIDDDNQEGYCDSCFSINYPICPECGWETYYLDIDEQLGICLECRKSNYTRCMYCGDWVDPSTIQVGYCPDCYSTQFTRMESHVGPYNIKWEDWADFAKESQTIEFGCDFDCNGQCNGFRDSIWESNRGCGCCRDCAYHRGYLDSIPPETATQVQALFDDTLGFWRPGGCTLPVAWRSRTCLTYACPSNIRACCEDTAGIKHLN